MYTTIPFMIRSGFCSRLALKNVPDNITFLLLFQTMYEKLVDQNRNAARANKVDPEVTLQFLKSAIYYFLTDKENSQGHLEAIESILGFTDDEREKIKKAMNRKSF